MAEKRDNYRHHKRIQVRFGIGTASASGFTEDISHFGLFVKAGIVQSPGRELIVELSLLQDRLVKLVAKVQWAKKVPPAMLRSCKAGMGLSIVRFLEGEEYYRALCEELQELRVERNSLGAKSLAPTEV